MLLAWTVEIRIGADRIVRQTQLSQGARQQAGLLQPGNIQVKYPQVFVPLQWNNRTYSYYSLFRKSVEVLKQKYQSGLFVFDKALVY